MPFFRKILIANRGEIALRVMRTCRDLGIRTVAVFSDADREAAHVRAADEALRLGPAPPAESYLAVEKVVGAARQAGADAIHPGYGFLSENPALPEACRKARIVFIGPDADPMAKLGNKLEARKLAERAGLHVLPGTSRDVREAAEIVECGRRWGFPLLLKAAAGGGGRGMRVVREAGRAEEELRAARGEARAAFGDPTVYVEKYLERPRHVEIQVLADRHGNAVALGERECSVQRRHQKLIEESPSPAAPRAVVQEAGERAAAICAEAGYAGAATFEFLMDADGNLTFMEVNTRLQVEHPITELRFGLDLVEQQIRIAAGRRLPAALQRRRPRGAAIEVRINAEDPERDFMPATGAIQFLRLPEGPGVRCDSALYPGYAVPLHYDSLLAKIITWGETRARALGRMRRALSECRILGVPTTLPFHRWVMEDTEFRAGRYSTAYVQERWETRRRGKGKSKRGAGARPGRKGDTLRLRAALAVVALEIRRGARAVLPAPPEPAWKKAFRPAPLRQGGGWSGRLPPPPGGRRAS
jgi:acetyl-CoA carboxylase biotin carboxylase subunit